MHIIYCLAEVVCLFLSIALFTQSEDEWENSISGDSQNWTDHYLTKSFFVVVASFALAIGVLSALVLYPSPCTVGISRFVVFTTLDIVIFLYLVNKWEHSKKDVRL